MIATHQFMTLGRAVRKSSIISIFFFLRFAPQELQATDQLLTPRFTYWQGFRKHGRPFFRRGIGLVITQSTSIKQYKKAGNTTPTVVQQLHIGISP